jgi:type IV secretion system protein VirB9
MKSILILICTAGINLHGQPVQVKRVQPQSASTAPKPDTALKERVDRDLEAVKKSLEADGKETPKVESVPVPAMIERPDVPLSPGAKAAVRVGEKWLTDVSAPAPGPDGRVLYSFGSGLPIVVCAPLRVCIVELQPGERIIGEPHIGDAVRWNIAPASYGAGETATTVVIVKPQEAGLDTNLLLTTDRRAYYLRLVSKPEEYIARVAFAYPADEFASQKWREHLARQDHERREATRIAQLPTAAPEALNFDYTTDGDRQLRPLQVFDDGAKTYIRMNDALKHRDTPVLVVVGPNDKPEMLNYRVKGSMYIADRIFDKAKLVLGAGKKVRKAEIRRGKAKRR